MIRKHRKHHTHRLKRHSLFERRNVELSATQYQVEVEIVLRRCNGLIRGHHHRKRTSKSVEFQKAR